MGKKIVVITSSFRKDGNKYRSLLKHSLKRLKKKVTLSNASMLPI
mgnify:CR=1 FL=1